MIIMKNQRSIYFRLTKTPIQYSANDMFFQDKFPFYKQLDAMDCGATCLRMVAKHYGRYYSIEYLRDITYVDREGVSLMSIADASERVGLHTLGVKVTYERRSEERRVGKECDIPC